MDVPAQINGEALLDTLNLSQGVVFVRRIWHSFKPRRALFRGVALLGSAQKNVTRPSIDKSYTEYYNLTIMDPKSA